MKWLYLTKADLIRTKVYSAAKADENTFPSCYTDCSKTTEGLGSVYQVAGQMESDN